MRGLGWIMITLGVVLVIWSAVITTSVHTDSNYLPGIGYQAPSDTYNLGLLQRQMMMLQAGLVLFLSGIVAACLGDLKIAMRRAGTANYEGTFEGGWEAEYPSSPSQPDDGSATQ